MRTTRDLPFLGILTVWVLVVVGCNEGRPSPPPGDSGKASQGTAAPTGAPKPSPPTWFRAGKPADGSQPSQPVPCEGIHSQQVEAGAAATVATGDGSVRVSVPPGAIDKSATMTIGKPRQLPDLPDPRLRTVAACDVSLAGRSVLDKPVDVEIAVDPSAMPADSPAETLAALYWHPRLAAWVSVPARVSEHGRSATIRTRHLTVFLLVLRPLNLIWNDSAFSEHFSIYYGRAAIAADAEASDEVFEGRLLAEAAGPGEPLSIARRTGQGRFSVEGLEGQPQYVVYLASALEYAHAKYRTGGLAVPAWTRSEIYVDVNWPFGGTSQRGKLLGAMWISPATDSMPRQVRTVTAHEYFHAIEAEYLGLAVMSMNYRTWWLEALAEYAPSYVWGDNADIKPLTGDFLFKPLVTQDDAHEYAAAHFVKYLVENRRFGLKSLVEGTLDVPASILAMEESSAADYAVLKSLLNTPEPFDDYTMGVTLGMLGNVCRARGADLTDLYADFAARLLFDADVTTLCQDGDGLLKVAELASTVETLYLKQAQIARNLTVPGGCACDLMAVRVENPDDAKLQPQKVRVIVPMPRPAGTRLDVYLLKSNQRVRGGAKPLARFAAGVNDQIDVSVGPEDVLYLLGTSRWPKEVTLPFTVRQMPAMGIIPPLVTPEAGQKEKLLAWATHVSPNAPARLAVSWDFGDGESTRQTVDRPAEGETLKVQTEHAWLKEGRFEVRADLLDAGDAAAPAIASAIAAAEVGPPGPSITLEARVIIAPVGKPFEVAATPQNSPGGVKYHWQFADGPILATDVPNVTLQKDAIGSYPIKVTMLSADKGVFCSDQATIKVEATEEVVWVREYDQRGGQKVLRLEYQVKAVSRKKHGIWRAFFIDGPGAGKVSAEHTYENDVERTMKTWHPNGQQSGQGQSDAKGRRTGVWQGWAPNGQIQHRTTYTDGVQNGPFLENFGDTGEPWRVGTFANGKAVGELTLFTRIGIKDGRGVYDKQITPFNSDGRIDGVQRLFTATGVLSWEKTFTNGVQNGPSRTYNEGRLWSEVTYENGKAVSTRIFNMDGTVKSERKNN